MLLIVTFDKNHVGERGKMFLKKHITIDIQLNLSPITTLSIQELKIFDLDKML